MKKYLLLIPLLLFFVVFLFTKENDKAIFIQPKNLHLADIVLRKGVGTQSEIISMILSSNLTHVGIVSSTNPIKIIHATYEDLGENGVVEFDWEQFSKGSKYIKIIRLNLDDEVKKKIVSSLKAKIGDDFKLTTDKDNLYCTTLIEKELKKHINVNLKYDYVDNLLLKGYILPPKSFLDLEHEIIYEK